VICGRHHRHCHAAPATTSGHEVVCGRHHRHCHAVIETRHRRSGREAAAAAPAAPTAGDNGTCRSVRIHGEWVQRCHFPGE